MAMTIGQTSLCRKLNQPLRDSPPFPNSGLSRLSVKRAYLRPCRLAVGDDTKSTAQTLETISTLDVLLGVQPSIGVDGLKPVITENDLSEVSEWWSADPQQAAIPRKQGMDAGEEGAFLDASWLTQGSMTESRAGPPTSADDDYQAVPVVGPRMTYVFLGLNVLVYGYGVYLALSQGDDVSNDFFFLLAKSNQEVVAGEYWRLLSSVFMHAGWLHLALNSIGLWQLGVEVEAVMGHTTFAAIYILSGVCGSTASFLASDVVTVGGSGAVFGLLGALTAYFIRNPDMQNSQRQLLFLFAMLSLNLVIGFSQDAIVDNSAHIAGFLAGLWLGYGMGPKYIVTHELDVPEGSMTVPEDAEEVQVVLDQTTPLQRGSVGITFSLGLAFMTFVGVMGYSGHFVPPPSL